MLVLVDDFKLGNKNFYFYSYLFEDLLVVEELFGVELEIFSFYIMIGIFVVGNMEDVFYISFFLINWVKDIFFKLNEEKGKYFFIGICLLKINNGLLIG